VRSNLCSHMSTVTCLHSFSLLSSVNRSHSKGEICTYVVAIDMTDMHYRIVHLRLANMKTKFVAKYKNKLPTVFCRMLAISEGHRFEAHPSRHVGTLGESLTVACSASAC